MKGIEARNLAAQLQYRGAGNPPSALPNSAISNAFPGLELDFRNAWKRTLVGIELHEASNLVMSVESTAPVPVQELKQGYRLVSIEGIPITVAVTGPSPVTPDEASPLPDQFGETRMPLEWSNALAIVIHEYSGKSVQCIFEPLDNKKQPVTVDFVVRPFFDQEVSHGETLRKPAIAKDIAPAGALTQSLCSPWQNDYRECACFYWAASRPDYVNVEPRSDGTSAGNNWMQKDRTASTPRTYIPDDFLNEALVNYSDLFQNWENALRFVVGGNDEPALTPPDVTPNDK